MAGHVFKLALVNALLAGAGHDVNQLEKIMFMLKLGAYIKRYMRYAEGFVQVFFDHNAGALHAGRLTRSALCWTTLSSASRKES